MGRKIFYSNILLIGFLVLQIGQAPNSFTLIIRHTLHIQICLQLQNKILGELSKHITHSTDLSRVKTRVLAQKAELKFSLCAIPDFPTSPIFRASPILRASRFSSNAIIPEHLNFSFPLM